MIGTNLFTKLPGSTVTEIALADSNGLAMFAKCSTVPETQASVYAVGCVLIRTDNGTQYQNTGTSVSPIWTLNGVV